MVPHCWTWLVMEPQRDEWGWGVCWAGDNFGVPSVNERKEVGGSGGMKVDCEEIGAEMMDENCHQVNHTRKTDTGHPGPLCSSHLGKDHELCSTGAEDDGWDAAADIDDFRIGT